MHSTTIQCHLSVFFWILTLYFTSISLCLLTSAITDSLTFHQRNSLFMASVFTGLGGILINFVYFVFAILKTFVFKTQTEYNALEPI